MKRGIALIVAAGALALPGAVRAADFGAAFATLHAMGLTNLSQAAYVKCREQVCYGLLQRISMSSRSGRSRSSLQGHAWMVREASNEWAIVIDEPESVFVLMHPQTARNPGANTNLLARLGLPRGIPVAVTTWERVDPAADLDRMLAYMKEQVEKGKSEWYGIEHKEMLICAAWFYDMGLREKASELVGLLLATSRDPREMLSGAMGMLADARYKKALERLYTTGDWDAFIAALDGLCAAFSGAWDTGSGAARLRDRLKAQRAAAASPPGGGKLSAADAALVAEIVRTKTGAEEDESGPWRHGYGFRQPLWSLADGDTNAPAEGPTNAPAGPKRTPLDRLCGRGPAAVPVLVALLGDETYVPASLDSLTRGSRYSSYRFETRHYMHSGNEEDAAVEQYARMDRPATLGEAARALLETVVPPATEETDETVPSRLAAEEATADLAKRATAWAETAVGQTARQRALDYLRRGASAQRAAAVSHLQGAGLGDSWPEIEKTIFLSSRPAEYFSLVRARVQRERAAARPLVERYLLAIKTAAENEAETAKGDEETLVMRRSSRGGQDPLKEMEKNLTNLLARPPVAVLLAKARADTRKTTRDEWAALYEELGEMPAPDRLQALLDAAVKADDAPARAQWASMALGMLATDEPAGAGAEAKPIEMLRSQTNALLVLLGDTRSAAREPRRAARPGLSPAVDRLWRAHGGSVADTVAAALLAYADVEARRGGREAADTDLLGDAGRAAVRARAVAALSGRPPAEWPALPDPASVPDARLGEIEAGIAKAAAADVPARLAALSDLERMALVERLDASSNLLARVQPAAMRVHVADLEGVPARIAAAWRGLDGQTLSLAAVSNLVRGVAEAWEAGCEVEATWMREFLFRGVRLSAVGRPAGSATGGVPRLSVSYAWPRGEGIGGFTRDFGAIPTAAAEGSGPAGRLAARLRQEAGAALAVFAVDAEAAAWRSLSAVLARPDRSLEYPACGVAAAVRDPPAGQAAATEADGDGDLPDPQEWMWRMRMMQNQIYRQRFQSFEDVDPFDYVE